MNEHLEKAKGALTHAAQVKADHDLNDESEKGARTDYARLLDIAAIQASVAQAEATDRLANVIEHVLSDPRLSYFLPDALHRLAQ